MTQEKPETWRSKIINNIIDKGSWGLIAFGLAAGWSWYQRLPSYNLNIRSVAVKIPGPSSEKAIDICRVTEEGRQEINKLVSTNPSLSPIDREMLLKVDKSLVISDLDKATQDKFNLIRKIVCKEASPSEDKDHKTMNPALLEIVAILSTEASYLVDRDCTLDIIVDKRGTQISSKFWDQKPTVKLKEVDQSQAAKIVTWNFNPLPIINRLTVLHSKVPIRAIVDKRDAKTFMVTETKTYDFDTSDEQNERRRFYNDKILAYLKKGDKLPISISCNILSVGQEPFQVTSTPFFADVVYLEPKSN